jgi:ech hydrogenase subunit E
VIVSVNVIGGVRRNPDAEQIRWVLAQLEWVEAELQRLEATMLEDYTVKKRTVGKGILTRQQAYELGAVGPTARGSGVAQDARQTGYHAYGELHFEPVVETDGDCWARNKVRFRETLASIDLIRRAINRMPDGEVRTKIKGVKPPQGETVTRVEQPRGELLYYLKGSGGKTLDRVRIRTPTFANIPPLLVMLPGHFLSDVPVVTLSIDPCISCTER